ncbi:MAG: AIM24 family protein [Verrucomicrobiota bacterium]
MQSYSLTEFLDKTQQRDRGQGIFELETDRFLEVNLNGSIWMKKGAMVAYNGQIKFTREGILAQGVGNLLKKAVSGEGAQLTKAEGTGQLYLADSGKKVKVLNLQNEAICVNGNDILAFEMQIDNKIKMMRKVSAMLSGGLFNVRLQGQGMIAFATHFEPLTLQVTPNNPVITDPNATVAWSANLEPTFRKDVSFKTFIGRGSGESFQMEFAGTGFVVVQPYEELYFQHTAG